MVIKNFILSKLYNLFKKFLKWVLKSICDYFENILNHSQHDNW